MPDLTTSAMSLGVPEDYTIEVSDDLGLACMRYLVATERRTSALAEGRQAAAGTWRCMRTDAMEEMRVALEREGVTGGL